MLPEKYTNRIKELLKEDADKYFESFDKPHFAGLRVNTLKIDVKDYKEIADVAIEPVPWTDKGFYYNTDDKPAKHPHYYAGLYYIQEPSAMVPAAYLPIEEGDKVLDLCAAPGGKSTELAAKLNGKGLLVTNDISASRAKALLKNIEISGVRNAIVTNEPPYNLHKYFAGYFDKVLVDAPCSGEGMFRKEPSIIKNWEQYGVEYYSNLQREIILYAADMLKAGGYMIYSTCTFSPEEDEGTLKYLLDNRPEFTVEKIDFDFKDHGHPEWIDAGDDIYIQIENARRLWPHNIKGEGHFVALLKKSEDAKVETGAFKVLSTNNKGRKNNTLEEFYEFIKEIDCDFDEKRFVVKNNRVFYLPEAMLDVKGIRVMREGLLMGEIKTKRFEPSQALASALKMSEFKNSVNFSKDDTRVIKYLKGESIDILESDTQYYDKLKNGWCLVCVDGYSLGFAKLNNNTLKNKYLPGWRWM